MRAGLIAPEVRHGERKVHSRVGELAQNLHVAKMVVEAEKHRLQPRAKDARIFGPGRPATTFLHITPGFFVLQ